MAASSSGIVVHSLLLTRCCTATRLQAIVNQKEVLKRTGGDAMDQSGDRYHGAVRFSLKFPSKYVLRSARAV